MRSLGFLVVLCTYVMWAQAANLRQLLEMGDGPLVNDQTVLLHDNAVADPSEIHSRAKRNSYYIPVYKKSGYGGYSGFGGYGGGYGGSYGGGYGYGGHGHGGYGYGGGWGSGGYGGGAPVTYYKQVSIIPSYPSYSSYSGGHHVMYD